MARLAGAGHGFLEARLQTLSLFLTLVAMPDLCGRASAQASALDYARDVAPIFDRHCVRCHGEQRQRKSLRLDDPHAMLEGGRGGPAVRPGASGESLVVRRILGQEGKRMPPEGPGLSEAELATLRSWIDAGAKHGVAKRSSTGHWAFRPIAEVELPSAADAPTATHPIDRFLEKAQRGAGVEPAPRADASTLLRRLSLDLRGLPPTTEERAVFLRAYEADPDAAWSEVVDRWLDDFATAEHRAAAWLDLARFADTRGYEADRRRTMWPWRDWVLRAFHANMPFDRFTKLQLAGDLMPRDETFVGSVWAEARDRQLATAFHRNTMTNDEGGTDDEEFRAAAVADRVATTFGLWFGLPLDCARCHDHKYDPISQREYFEVYAFFDQSADRDRNDDAPLLAIPADSDQAQRLDQLEAAAHDARSTEAAAVAAVDADLECAVQQALADLACFERQPPRLGPWEVRGPLALRELASPPALRPLNPNKAQEVAKRLVEADDLRAYAAVPQAAATTGAGIRDRVTHRLEGEQSLWVLERRIEATVEQRVVVSLVTGDAFALFLDGRRVAGRNREQGKPLDERIPLLLTAGEHQLTLAVVNIAGAGGFSFAVDGLDFDETELAALRREVGERSPGDLQLLMAACRRRDPHVRVARARRVDALRDLEAFKGSLLQVPVMVELAEGERRATRLHRRGSFLDLGPEVAPATPRCLHPFHAAAPRNRLGLAEWIVAPENPLTPRVIVDREWARFFGRGLMGTPEDWGTQGDVPLHAALLDWLAAEFWRDYDLRRLTRLIVTSEAYRRQSFWPGERPPAVALDAENALHLLGPRARLPAEAIRDSVLAVSGLLSRQRFGPPVMPPQPEGVWSIVYSSDKWVESRGDERYRRSLYTFWRRTSPYPALTIFDTPSREFCVLRRLSSATPLQALVLMNDPVVVTAAQAVGASLADAHGMDWRAGGRALFERTLARTASEAELAELEAAALAELAAATSGQVVDAREIWTFFAMTVFGLDEFVRTR